MRLLLTILCFIALQANSQALFHAHNKVSASGPTFTYAAPPVTSGLVAHYQSAVGITLDEDGTVSEWQDMSGAGHHLTQSDALRRPHYNLSTLNGYPTLTNYVAHYLTTPNFLSTESAATVFWLVKLSAHPPATSETTGAPVVFGTRGGDYHYSWTDGTIYYGNGANNRYSFTPTSSLASWHTFTTVAATGDWRAYLNGTLQYSNASNVFYAESSALTVFGNAGTFNVAGDMVEVIIYNRVLNDTEREQVRTFLNTRYGL